MWNFMNVVILGFFLISAACSEKTGYRVDHYSEVNIRELPEDIKIPSQAWDLIEMKSSGGHAEAKAEGHGEGHGAESAKPPSIVFSEVSVFLVEKNPGVLQQPAVRINLSKGGGTIDLSQWTSGEDGSFFVGFEFPAFKDAKSKKVVFVSNARRRKIQSQIFGAGCNQILDVTDRFFKEMAGQGIKVNTTQNRYVGVIGGTFLFSAQSDNEIHVAQVTFKNPRLSTLFCKE